MGGAVQPVGPYRFLGMCRVAHIGYEMARRLERAAEQVALLARWQPLNRIRDKELGWGKLAEGGVDLYSVPGRHGQSVLSEPHVQVLAAKVKDCRLNSKSVKGKSNKLG